MNVKFPRHRPLGIHLDVTNRLWQNVMGKLIRFTDINRPHWLVLSAIEELGNGCNLTQITTFLNIEISTCSRALAFLEKNQLIIKDVSSKDKRSKGMQLTASGRAVLYEIDCVAQNVRKKMLADITPEQLATFHFVLDSIRHHATDILKPKYPLNDLLIPNDSFGELDETLFENKTLSKNETPSGNKSVSEKKEH